MTHQITDNLISCYREHLLLEEYADSTVQKYLRDIRAFVSWMAASPDLSSGDSLEPGEREGSLIPKHSSLKATRLSAVSWKSHLIAQGYSPVTINAMLSSLNGFFRFLGWEDCRVKFLKIQRRMFRSQDRELNQAEYRRLLEAAWHRGDARLALLLEAICSTGIRVSEVKYITVEAVLKKRAEISLKGKIRTILLPGKLCKKLKSYAKKQDIPTGEIFLTRNRKSISRGQIWKEMKYLCGEAGVNPSKVFPHNLRHLFARTFYKICRDIVKLADVLGHSSIETTRIYLISTGETHARQMERLGLVS